MKKYLFYIFCLSLPLSLCGQYPLNFLATFDQSPPPFAPIWQGDTTLFGITSGQLRLNNPNPQSANDHFISVLAPTSYQAVEPTVWRLTVALDFNPSGSNYAEWMLRGNLPDPAEATEAYILQMGGTSGSTDALQLWRQDGDERTLLLSGTEGAVATNPLVHLEIIHDPDGNWSLYADYGGTGNLNFEGIATDTTYPSGLYSGIRCIYSSTRNQAFGFDDWSIAPLTQDIAPPTLVSALPISATQIQLTFSEPILLGSGSDLSTFSLSPDQDITRFALTTPDQITLDLGSPLNNATEYTVTVSQISDLSGNISNTLSATFTYLVGQAPEPGQLVISEFFANPSNDLAGLPAVEYMELYNASQQYLELSETAVRSGATLTVLPPYVLAPGQFVALFDRSNQSDFPAENTLPVDGLPGLSNNGDDLLIERLDGSILESLTYTNDWYTPLASNGLASLERIRFDLPADCIGNWSGSTATIGGTPGLINSVVNAPLETHPPALASVSPLSDLELLVTFSEQVDRAAATNPGTYSITPLIGIDWVEPTETGFLLLLEQPLEARQGYVLTVNTIADCLGNTTSSPLSVPFGLAEKPEAGDLIINELLFFPQVGGNDFVELYNASNKIISLQGLTLKNDAKETGNTQTSLTTPRLLFPGQYAALTESATDLMDRYPIPDSAIILDQDIPSFDSDAGNVTLIHGTTVLDAFHYSKDLHNALLENERGVSLERISANLPTQSAGNWTSAAAAAGFATPGYRNSQSVVPSAGGPDIFQVSHPTFSPDGDGQEDILRLDYQAPHTGYIANVRIFDDQGRPIRTLARNELLATSGRLIWDGALDSGEAARTGIYLIWIELFLPEGETHLQREYCVLARRFN